jgi:hypothetical protein
LHGGASAFGHRLQALKVRQKNLSAPVFQAAASSVVFGPVRVPTLEDPHMLARLLFSVLPP